MKKRFSFSVMLFSLAFATFVSCKKNDDNPQQPSLQVPKMEVTAPKGDFVNGTTSKPLQSVILEQPMLLLHQWNLQVPMPMSLQPQLRLLL